MDPGRESQSRLAVVVIIDGLRASALGAYGNTNYPTPLFDEFASRSLVVEWLMAEGTTLTDFYQAAVPTDLWAGLNGRLVTDDDGILPFVGDSIVTEVILGAEGKDRSAHDVETTHSASFFSQATGLLAVWHKQVVEQQTSGLMWLHFSGLSGPWDSPLAMRQDLLDDDDPPAPEFVIPPAGLRGVTDPDELLSYRVAYAAQVAVVETCLAGFMEAFDELPFDGEKLAMISGARGFALGEHGCVGHDCGLLYSEHLHLPWLALTGAEGAPLPRATGFAQPVDIGATLAHWFGGPQPGPMEGRSLVPLLDSAPGRLRDAVVAKNAAGDAMIRTPAWMMTRGATTELYAKPDDRWEANDVANRCPEIVEALSDLLDEFPSGIAEPLADELTSPWR